ncbi:MAG: hypothetical protein M1816_000752 [Peltula sp. TS41687]|nr:MAG: hypothetical protein M1816_000752 [Peltula sp. TS41687]
MPPDHSKFLYTIVKQLDLKSIDWAAVAAQLNITNGHAARMRFSRFKQAMEGVVPAPRRRTTGGSSRPRKVVKSERGPGKRRASDNIKSETPAEAPSASRVKDEPTEVDTTSYPSSSTDPLGGSSGDLNQASSGPDLLSPETIPPPFTMPPQAATPGPSRREFGPFAGAYPPPGVMLEPQQDQSPMTAVKQEPRW